MAQEFELEIDPCVLVVIGANYAKLERQAAVRGIAREWTSTAVRDSEGTLWTVSGKNVAGENGLVITMRKKAYSVPEPPRTFWFPLESVKKALLVMTGHEYRTD